MGEVRLTEEVFGVCRDLPLTYVEREHVDKVLLSSLSRKKHIVIYGGSKQGKTSLRKYTLNEKDCIVVQCQSDRDRRELYGMILKEAGANITISESKTLKGVNKVWVEFKAKLTVPFIGEAEARSRGEDTAEKSTTTETKNIEIDVSDANDIIRILKDMIFTQFIVLEDFHYLDIDVQKKIAIDLKIFHEKSDLSFIVVGVWLEQNRLILYNGDLTNRVIPINADEWRGESLYEVIKAGESLLNISFLPEVVSAIISASHGNVGLVQEICWNLCENLSVHSTQEDYKEIGSVDEVDNIACRISHEQSGRYRNFIHDFSMGFQNTEHELYKWILAWVIVTPIKALQTGISQSDMYRNICTTHPNKDQLKLSSIAQALRNISRLQQKKHVQPVILDFNSNDKMLRVVDTGFILFLEREDTADLLDIIKLFLKSKEDSIE